MPKNKVPSGKKITYTNPVCNYCPRKDDPYYIILIIGGDKIPYLLGSDYPAATLSEEKILFNSIISTPGYQFICSDIKDCYLCSPMECFKYIKIPFRWIPEEIHIQ